MELSIQERLKELYVERGLTLEQLAVQTHLSKSALDSYEAEDFKDISHYALIKLTKFYGVTANYLLGLSETKNHQNLALNANPNAHTLFHSDRWFSIYQPGILCKARSRWKVSKLCHKLLNV